MGRGASQFTKDLCVRIIHTYTLEGKALLGVLVLLALELILLQVLES